MILISQVIFNIFASEMQASTSGCIFLEVKEFVLVYFSKRNSFLLTLWQLKIVPLYLKKYLKIYKNI